jgi:hypothetical protein
MTNGGRATTLRTRRMKVVLHIGMTKAGSSALQAGLFTIQKQLMDSGILYPVRGRARNSHVLLLYGLVPPERLPRGLRHLHGNDIHAIEEEMHAWLLDLQGMIGASQPQTLILSEEFLFYVIDHEAQISLRDRLDSLGCRTVDVVVYVRRPSDHYLASIQQLLKASHRLPGPNPIEYRRTIEGYARHVADRVHVIKYDRLNWPRADILRQFLDSFVPQANVSIPESGRQVNRSLSSEAMSLLADYRRSIWPEAHNQFTTDTDRLVRALELSDVEVAGDAAPRLHEEIAREVDEASIDLLWLRDAHGITFDGVDYSEMGPAPGRRPPIERVEDICPIDPDRRRELTSRAFYHLAREEVATPRPAMRSPRDAAIPSGGRVGGRIAGLFNRRRRGPTEGARR